MNLGQQMFYKFYIGIAKDDKKEEAEALLKKCFEKQDAGTFDKKAFEEAAPEFFALIKPEKINELKAAMSSFASKL